MFLGQRRGHLEVTCVVRFTRVTHSTQALCICAFASSCRERDLSARRARIAEAQRRRWRAYRANQSTKCWRLSARADRLVLTHRSPLVRYSPEPAGAFAGSSATHLVAGARIDSSESLNAP